MPIELTEYPGGSDHKHGSSCGSAVKGEQVSASADTSTNSGTLINSQGGKVCGAKRRSGGICQKSAMPNGRCRLHGGLTPKGEALPQYKHGRYSKYMKDMPEALRKGYNSALKDENLLSLRDDIAALESRQRELFRQMEATPAPPWEDARRAMAAVNIAMGSGDQEQLRTSLLALAEVVDSGVVSARAYESCWTKLNDAVDRKTRVATAEWKMLNELGGVVPVEQAMAFLRALLSAAREVVTDPKQLQQLQMRTMAFLPTPQE